MNELATQSLNKSQGKSQLTGFQFLCAILDKGKLKAITPSARIALLVLIRHCGGRTVCYPSIGKLAFETGLNRKTVQRALQELRAKGFLYIHRERFNTRQKLFFRLTFPESISPVEKPRTPPKPKGSDLPKSKSKTIPNLGSDLVLESKTESKSEIKEEEKPSPKGTEIFKVSAGGNGRNRATWSTVGMPLTDKTMPMLLEGLLNRIKKSRQEKPPQSEEPGPAINEDEVPF